MSDSHLRHVGAMGPFRCVRFKLRQMACFHQLTPRTQQSQIANALSTLQHQHKNKTPTTGRVIFVAEYEYNTNNYIQIPLLQGIYRDI